MKNLRELRENSGYTQQEIADKLGIQRPTYSRYESDERQPDFNTLLNLAKIFDVSVDYLLDVECDSDELTAARLKTKEWLLSTDMTIPEIEKAITINYATLRAWANGYGDYFNNKLSVLSNLMKCSTDSLIGRDAPYVDITYDDFSYAMYNEAKELTEDQKEMLLDMAKTLKNRLKEKGKLQ